MEPEIVLPDGAVIVPGDGGAGGVTLGYGGPRSGDPLFPRAEMAHGRDLADAVANLNMWIAQRKGQGRAGREPLPVVFTNNNIRPGRGK